MTHRARVAAALAAFALSLVASCGEERAASVLTPAQEEAAAFVRDWCAAYARNDAAALERILAPDYIHTSGTGVLTDRASSIKAVRAGTVRYSRVDSRDIEVRVLGDTAVVTGQTHMEGVGADGKRFAIDFRFTDTLARTDGAWKALAAHTSKLPAP